MADTFTAHFDLYKTEIGASEDTWGAKDHENWDAVDQALYNNQQASAVNANEITILEGQVAALQAILRPGSIILWNTAYGAIPAGWQLCNGTNGSPDLRDKFIVGAGGTYANLATGGALTHTHTGGTIGSHALTMSEMPAHEHDVAITDPGHVHSLTDPGHTHAFATANDFNYYSAGGVLDQIWRGTDTDTTNSSKTGISMANTKAGVTVSESSKGSGAGHTHTFTGLSTANHLPPYIALCYIMKLP